MKKTVAILMILAVTAVSFSAYAGNPTNTRTNQYSNGNTDLEQELIQLPDFKFWNYDKNGIGYGNCPVYTAPYKDAYRCADGKASCQTNKQMSDAGIYGGWLLVRYETNNGGYRVGYIPPEYIRGFQSQMGNRRFEHFVPAVANDTIFVTDNPMMLGSSFATLDPGEQFYVLAKYTYFGDWWYIECTVAGQIARGFIDRSGSSFSVGHGNVSVNNPTEYRQTNASVSYGIPSVSPLGTTCIGDVKIDGGYTGDRKIVRQNAGQNYEQVSVVYPGKQYPCYGQKNATNGRTWYYIWVDDDSAWGWVSSGFATLIQ